MKDLKHIEMISDEVMDSAKEYAQKIKPIDEHVWSDDFIHGAIVADLGLVLDIGDYEIEFNIKDVETMAGALGYIMVKRQSGGVKG